MTRVLRVQSPLDPTIGEAAEILSRGGLVAFPTETVYGLGALGLDPEAVERIFQAKGRPKSDPLILHVADHVWVWDLARQVTPQAETLMSAFWPGPLTLVLDKADCVPSIVTAGGDTVAVRMPNHAIALELIRQVGSPVAAPSANLFSRPSPTTAEHVLQDLKGRIDAVLDGGPVTVGVESTVVDVRSGTPVVLRPGGVTRGDLERVLGMPVQVRGGEPGAEGPLASPGLLEKHYSPRAEICLFDGPHNAVIAEIRRRALTEPVPEDAAILAYSEDVPEYGESPVRIRDIGSSIRQEEVARSLYAAFRELDEQGVRRLYTRLAPPGGLGDAINDRLMRAASGRIIAVLGTS